MLAEARQERVSVVLLALSCITVALAATFMTQGVQGNWSFVLPFRGAKLATLVLVGIAVALSTVIFQTITDNRILTPSIMGFDALYGLIQTSLIFAFGSGAVSAAGRYLMFAGEATIMIAFAVLLYRWLFLVTRQSLHLLMLVGIVLGIFLRSIAGFLQRVMDPTEFLILQDRLFASFNSVDPGLLYAAGAVILVVAVLCWRFASLFDVLALGREMAINLGVNHRGAVSAGLFLVTLLVAVSTALVGPVMFFGLLVANLAYLAVPMAAHRVVLPVAALLAVSFLVGGQLILERVLGLETALSVVIEFVGGIVFVILVVRGTAR